MIASKFWLILSYTIVGVAVIGWPFRLNCYRNRLSDAALNWIILLFFALMACGLLVARGTPSFFSPFVLAVSLAAPFIGIGVPTIVASLTALPALAGLTWWAPSMQLSPASEGRSVF